MGRVWAKLANEFVDLQGDQSLRKIVALFVATLHLRHPQTRRVTSDILKAIVDFFGECPKDELGNPTISEIRYRGEIRPFDSAKYLLRGAGQKQVHQTFNEHIHALATRVAEAVMEKRWSVVFSDSPAFVTTDTPVAIVNPGRRSFGIKTPGTIVSVPLSPNRVLIMDDLSNQPKGQYYPLGDHGPAPFNLMAWGNCERFMISSRDPDQVCTEMCRWSEGAA
jgi:hypothetical protein